MWTVIEVPRVTCEENGDAAAVSVCEHDGAEWAGLLLWAAIAAAACP
jgi:hypothetical protein